jgi:hypothetical protein
VSIAFWSKFCPVDFNLDLAACLTFCSYQGSYEFAVNGAGEDYIDLFNTYLFVEAQIVNTNGSNLDPDTDVGPVDL